MQFVLVNRSILWFC